MICWTAGNVWNLTVTCGLLLTQPSSTTSTVLIHGPARENPLCKHTSWISDRVPLEVHTSQVGASHGPIHETILSSSGDTTHNDDLRLLEGLITNFFVGTCCLFLQVHVMDQVIYLCGLIY